MSLWNLLGPEGDMYCLSNTYRMLVTHGKKGSENIKINQVDRGITMILIESEICMLLRILKFDYFIAIFSFRVE